MLVIQEPRRHLCVDDDGTTDGGKVFAHLTDLSLADLVVVDELAQQLG